MYFEEDALISTRTGDETPNFMRVLNWTCSLEKSSSLELGDPVAAKEMVSPKR